MSRKKKSKSLGINNADEHQLHLIKLIRQFSYRHPPYQVFTDFVEVSALAISNRVDLAQYEPREARYMQIIGKYTKEETALFPQMFAALVDSFALRDATMRQVGTMDRYHSSGLTDILGQVYMNLEIANERSGQFFTPYEVSRLMALLTFGDPQPAIESRGYVTLMEPACGSAGMVIAIAEAMHEKGVNYQQALHATCTDIDPVCVHMAYVQLSLLHIPAIIIHGNSLSMESWAHWYTPAHILGGWTWRLKLRQRTGFTAKWRPYPQRQPGRGKRYRELKWKNATPQLAAEATEQEQEPAAEET